MRGFAYLLSAVALACVSQATAQTAPPPADAYGRLPAVSDAAISPDGHRVLISVAAANSTGVQVINVDTGAVERTIAAPADVAIRGVRFANNQRALLYVSMALSPSELAGRSSGTQILGAVPHLIEYWRTRVLDVTTGVNRDIEVDEQNRWAHTSLIARAPIQGEPDGARMVSGGDRGLTIYRVDLGRANARQQQVGDPDTVGFVINNAGSVVARLQSNEDTNHWRILMSNSDERHPLLEGDSEIGTPPDVNGLLADGRLAVVLQGEGTNRDTLVALNVNTGAQETLVANDNYDIESTIRDPWSMTIVGAAWREDLPKQQFFDPAIQAAYERLQTHFAGAYATISSWSQDKSRILVYGETAENAGSYYIYEPATDRVRLLRRAYPELTNVASIGERQSITYRARDGVRVHAYLTLPAGVEARNLPVVLLVHGGPHARDDFTFDWWAAFLASRGYAVLQPNYRGSTGYGYQWFNSGRGGWGDGVMQTDVEDGVDALVRGHIGDPQRICIVGASYGGYAALAGATITPTRYRCAASIAGVSDIVRMQQDTERLSGGRRSATSDWWRLSMGDRRADGAHLQAISPANLAAQVQAPVLLIHGRDDTVVPIIQSRLMRDRLQAAGKQVRYVELDGDDHWLSEAATRTQMLRELDAFLSENLRAPLVTIDDSAAPSVH